LAFPQNTEPFYIKTNNLDYATRAILSQKVVLYCLL